MQPVGGKRLLLRGRRQRRWRQNRRKGQFYRHPHTQMGTATKYVLHDNIHALGSHHVCAGCECMCSADSVCSADTV